MAMSAISDGQAVDSTIGAAEAVVAPIEDIRNVETSTAQIYATKEDDANKMDEARKALSNHINKTRNRDSASEADFKNSNNELNKLHHLYTNNTGNLDDNEKNILAHHAEILTQLKGHKKNYAKETDATKRDEIYNNIQKLHHYSAAVAHKAITGLGSNNNKAMEHVHKMRDTHLNAMALVKLHHEAVQKAAHHVAHSSSVHGGRLMWKTKGKRAKGRTKGRAKGRAKGRTKGKRAKRAKGRTKRAKGRTKGRTKRAKGRRRTKKRKF